MSAESFSPADLREALEIKARLGGAATVIAGGTDLMVQVRLGAPVPGCVLDISRIEDLRRIEKEGDALFIGATATFSQIVESSLVQEMAPVLHAAAGQVGAVQIRNRATLGGNVATGSPAGDSLPPLWVLDAAVLCASLEGERRVPFRRFYTGYRRSVLGDDEILLGLVIPECGAGYVSEFCKVGPRRAQAVSKLSLACMAKMKTKGKAKMKAFEEVRLAAGSVAPVVIGLEKTAAYLRGRRPGTQVIEKARRLAMDEVTPIDDVRSTAEYRRIVVGNLVARFIEKCSDLRSES